jgi:8-oxo-dGTP diphosphatase
MKRIEVVAAIIINKDSILATQRGYGNYKGLWEFPGGKIEPGELKEEALIREIREELVAEIIIKSYFIMVDYDYPDFHLTLHCYLCELVNGEFKLVEHENARWLKKNELDSVEWLPADIEIIDKLKG